MVAIGAAPFQVAISPRRVSDLPPEYIRAVSRPLGRVERRAEHLKPWSWRQRETMFAGTSPTHGPRPNWGSRHLPQFTSLD